MTTPKIRPPPTGHASWLDYAVDTMDTRSIEIESLFDDVENAPTREAMRHSARAELDALRQATATIRSDPGDAVVTVKG
ncbi:hypothetical protein [Propionivibrio sp.]|uniref:hypothetical protein n=1 Tax=Propionivibrio sp. TaxID=2212460 RepID=UPI003BF30D65